MGETENTGEFCSACSGEIVKLTTKEYNPMSGPPIIGPSSRNQFRDVSNYHCSTCGIQYAFLRSQLTKEAS